MTASMRTAACLLASLALLLALWTTRGAAVERSKFRTCAQTAFCQRNRALVDTVRQREPSAVAPGAPRVDSPERLRLGVALRKAPTAAQSKAPPPVFGERPGGGARARTPFTRPRARLAVQPTLRRLTTTCCA